MRFTRKTSVHVLAGLVAGAGAITAVACGGDDSTDTTAGDGGASSTSSSTSGGTTSSSGSTTSSSGSTTSSSGSTSGDGGGDAGSEAGDGGGKAIGDGPCDAGTQCQSGVCFVPNNKPANSFCTVKCTMLGDTDPACANNTALTGKCNGEGYCQKK